jgi:mannose-1-phosphate guanylyltransferase
MLYSVIIAGGVGTRLWPLSREARPKQLLRFGGDASLLQQAVDRLSPMVPAERTLIVTHRDYLPAISQQAPALPAANLLGEPVGRNTAAAIGWAAEALYRRDPDAVMVVLTADHVIRPKETLQAAVARAAAVLEREPWALVTFGIKPRSPHTGYGYLHLGDRLPGDGPPAHKLIAFREKPDAKTAEEYLAGGKHLWNSGMFAWRAETLRKRMAECLPDLAGGLREIVARGTPPGLADYNALPKISIDYGIMEPSAAAGLVRCVGLDLEWHDLGGYGSLEAVLPRDEAGNTVSADPAVLIGSKGSIVIGEPGHLVAVVGLDDVVVVQTPDATLVCKRSETERLREVVEELKKRKLGKHL